MKIALCSSYIPFIQGGYRNIVDWLAIELKKQGHHVEVIYLPHDDSPDTLFQQMSAYRWIDLTDTADRIICFRPPSHIIPHDCKILWFIHHIRIFYDLWNTPYRNFPNNMEHNSIRSLLKLTDTKAIQESRFVFANSQVVSNRLSKFNGIKSEVLYPPLYLPERFKCASFNDEIVCISRLEHHKRQHLLIEALKYTRSNIKLRLCGAGGAYAQELDDRIHELRLEGRVIIQNRWISEEEKVNILSVCLGVAYLPVDEDSYGYASLEASHSSKPIMTTSDSGGVLELVTHGYNGLVSSSDPKDIASSMDKLNLDRASTIQMGKNAHHRLSELNISWTHVINRLLA